MAKRKSKKEALNEQPQWGAISIVAVVAVVAISVLYFGLGDQGAGAGRAWGDLGIIGDNCTSTNPIHGGIEITDNDGDGYHNVDAECNVIDCDDNNAAINPGIVESPGDPNTCGFDYNCDGLSVICAEIGEGAVYQSGFTATYPEICGNGVDDDGDGDIDEPDCTEGFAVSTVDQAEFSNEGKDTTYAKNTAIGYSNTPGEDCGVDEDGDGYELEVAGCNYIYGTVFDCNDFEASIYPGAPEVCNDKIDQDCDGSDYEVADKDSDGYMAGPNCGTPVDCNDENPTIYPGAIDICDDGVDQNCDNFDSICREKFVYDERALYEAKIKPRYPYYR